MRSRSSAMRPRLPHLRHAFCTFPHQLIPRNSLSLFPSRRGHCQHGHSVATTSSAETPRGVSQHNRRRGVGLPKGVDNGFVQKQLTADESPWEDYLIPTLDGNTSPKNASRYTEPRAPFYVLGVESSCDDTAAAVVSSSGEILGAKKVGQDAQTAEWGGVVPDVAREAHEAAIEQVISGALAEAGMSERELHAVSATMGPGLEVCLRVGYRAAREVARRADVDFVGVNHLEAHILVPRLEHDIHFPFLTLLVSGGHCQLLLVRNVADYAALGGTLDDALGEAYDKTARLLGLPLRDGGGGPALEIAARGGNGKAIPFPVPMRKRADCNFSFAGLKTSVRTAVRRLGGVEVVRGDGALISNLAASFQETAIKHLEQRTRRALRRCGDVGHLVVSGGVAANLVVRERMTLLAESEGVQARFPRLDLCTDNGVMVAWAGVERLRCGIATDFRHLDVRARWPIAKMIDNEMSIVGEGSGSIVGVVGGRVL